MIIDFSKYKVRITDKSVNKAFAEKVKIHQIAEYVQDKINTAFKKAICEELGLKPDDFTVHIEGDLSIIDDDSLILKEIQHECDYCAYCDNSDIIYGIDTNFCTKRNCRINKEEIESIRKEGGCKDFTLWARYLKSEKER